VVEAALREACEDRLGAALIRPGDSVIIRKVVLSKQAQEEDSSTDAVS